MPQDGPVEVVILGAGVIGLTVAYTLLTTSPNAYKIKIVARDMPDDLSSQAFASPWAGANWSPMRGSNDRTRVWERATINKMWELTPQGLAMELPSRVFFTTNEDLSQLWYKDLVKDFRVLDPSEVPAGLQGGIAFKTFSINPELYLPWLQSELLARGVEFVRRKVHSLGEAAALAGPNSVLVNATGIGARSLIGVEDADVHPIRGQTIIVHAPGLKEFVSLPLGAGNPGEATYIIPRPSPPGEVLLGGTFQPDNWDTSVDVATAKGILERCAALAPQLKDAETRILRHNVGLRPARKGGPRVEAAWTDVPLKSELLPLPESDGRVNGRVLLVHAYGFGAAGYQNSWGAAQEVADLIASSLKN
ncbi:nucleotide-binding domain-containing protein [Rhodofomes roseus]|uniref:Nucleotide-binding domain-containing protein n=1 Tax=Rhodofomes roseus TaxID=34475 RepID=A0ABQ8KHC7_9APHY|nr:nucleotide-binding domain-containing protein [Rhodofomes roseus]KAH9837235.1 nucleotide-binding domain-containing protein [Rhodofomes roseus]